MLTLLIILTIIALFFLVLVIYIFIILLYTKVPFVKTPKKSINIILDKISISAKDTIYDIGCGDASMLIAIEKKFGAKTIGYEISPWAYALGRLNIYFHNSKTKILFKNFYKEDLSGATMVFCFLIVAVMEKVGRQLISQLKPGTKVISYGFHIPDWKPINTIDTNPKKPNSSKIFIYIID